MIALVYGLFTARLSFHRLLTLAFLILRMLCIMVSIFSVLVFHLLLLSAQWVSAAVYLTIRPPISLLKLKRFCIAKFKAKFHIQLRTSYPTLILIQLTCSYTFFKRWSPDKMLVPVLLYALTAQSTRQLGSHYSHLLHVDIITCSILSSGLQLQYNEPQIYDSNLQGGLPSVYPSMYAAIHHKHQYPSLTNNVTLTTTGREKFVSFAKRGKFEKGKNIAC